MFSPFTLGRRAPAVPSTLQGKVVPLRTPQPSKPIRDPAVRIA
ncbi:hypothetical protein QWZ03_07350 [Chitinimonas viridis]|uniref:Uncharacterized protein n=1 Tax=Chitinimonas viridis TaxID=664880 RepID=A0ABT8B432_9NEIS|nr:hypothetical protein [Chitinimonas viridis]MDN3576580.1 hypothetical protein [Chitinimonas viridis]